MNLWYKPGDRVLLIKGSVTDKKAIKPKALIPTDGPFTVSKALSNDRYVLTDLKTRRIRDTVHVSRLLPYFPPVAEDEPTWMLKVPPTNGRWPIHGIVGRRVLTLKKPDGELGLRAGEKVLQYKVRWLGYDRTWDTWRPVQTLADIIELVHEYNSVHPLPADLCVEFSETLERDVPFSSDPVQPSEAAVKRHHMRTLPHAGEQRPRLDPETPSVEQHTSHIAETAQHLTDIGSAEPPSPASPIATTDHRERRRLERARKRAESEKHSH